MNEFSGVKALVVDDDPDLREVLVEDLRGRGCETFEAANGVTAFEIVKAYDLDIVITDVQMPGGDGVELLCQIKKYKPERPIVIMITGFTDISTSEMCKRGAFTVLAKPFTREVFINTLTNALRNRLKTVV